MIFTLSNGGDTKTNNKEEYATDCPELAEPKQLAVGPATGETQGVCNKLQTAECLGDVTVASTRPRHLCTHPSRPSSAGRNKQTNYVKPLVPGAEQVVKKSRRSWWQGAQGRGWGRGLWILIPPAASCTI